MSTLNISLPEPMRNFIEDQVRAGGYSTASEYLRELVRKAQKETAKEKLEAMLLEGMDSGPAIEVTPEFWKDMHSRLDERIKKAKKK